MFNGLDQAIEIRGSYNISHCNLGVMGQTASGTGREEAPNQRGASAFSAYGLLHFPQTRGQMLGSHDATLQQFGRSGFGVKLNQESRRFVFV